MRSAAERSIDMNYELEAKFASLEEDDERLVFALAADDSGDGKYVMFQLSLRAEDQDRRLGLDGLYIECDDQSRGCYLGVESIRRAGNRIEIGLTDKGKQSLKVQQVCITPISWDPTITQGLERLDALSGGAYNVQL
jgi:hypothetical protein